MTPIRSLGVRLEVGPLLQEISENPDVWNRHTARLHGVHREVSDIWVRYNAWENCTKPGFNEPHESVWYPVVSQIPSVKGIAFDVMRLVEGERLGGILITKVPAGGEVKPHKDGGWHAQYYEKFAVQLASTPDQAFCFEDARLSAEVGELYTFDNSQVHWVENPSTQDRMTLIICIRRSVCHGAQQLGQ